MLIEVVAAFRRAMYSKAAWKMLVYRLHTYMHKAGPPLRKALAYLHFSSPAKGGKGSTLTPRSAD